jgi:hypothetical protein
MWLPVRERDLISVIVDVAPNDWCQMAARMLNARLGLTRFLA